MSRQGFGDVGDYLFALFFALLIVVLVVYAVGVARLTALATFGFAIHAGFAAGSDCFRLGAAATWTTPAFPLLLSSRGSRLKPAIGAIRAFFRFLLNSPNWRLTPRFGNRFGEESRNELD